MNMHDLNQKYAKVFLVGGREGGLSVAWAVIYPALLCVYTHMCIRTAPRFTPRAGATHKTEGTSASMNCGPLCLRDWNKLVPCLEILGIWDYLSTKQNLFYFLGNCWNVHEC